MNLINRLLDRSACWVLMSVCLAWANPARAAGEVSMWFGDALGNPTSEVRAAQGRVFDVYVWMSCDSPVWYVEAAVGFDRTSAPGPEAIPMDGKIVLASGNPGVDIAAGAVLRSLPVEMCRCVAGLNGDPGTTRPYGADIARASMTGTVGPFERVSVARLSLRSLLSPEESYSIVLWSDAEKTAGGRVTLAHGEGAHYPPLATLVVRGLVETAYGVRGRDLCGPSTMATLPDYTWVLWGKADLIDSDSFYVDDGSGCRLIVAAPAHGVADGSYVRVQGKFEAATTTLISQHLLVCAQASGDD